MYAKTYSASLEGLDAMTIEVEIDIAKGLPAFGIVGLADKSINESKERISVAMKSSGFPIPPKRILVNLAPAYVRKEGPQFDLAIAAALMKGLDYIKCDEKLFTKFSFLGELSLTGELKPLIGVLPLALSVLEHDTDYLILAKENLEEANIISLLEEYSGEEKIQIFGISNLYELKELVETLSKFRCLQVKDLETSGPQKKINKSEKNIGELEAILNKYRAPTIQKISQGHIHNHAKDFSDVIGQAQAKRGLEIAACGKHHSLMIGPPGCGKSMLATRFPSLLPDLSFSEALSTTKIYSISGLLKNTLMLRPPIRSPHHSSSPVALVGGGVPPKPGEISLAHNGVLFLDELTEFPRYVIEQLRQITDNKEITLNKRNISYNYPADFLLIAACNPCPCGYLGDSEKSCSCSPSQISRYISKLSGPLLDRIDIHLELNRLSQEELEEITRNFSKQIDPEGRTSAVKNKTQSQGKSQIQTSQELVNQAKAFRAFRLAESKKNSKFQAKSLKIGKESSKFLHEASKNLNFSARSHAKILKLARTIADMDISESISMKQIAEAFQYRAIDWDKYLNPELRTNCFV